MDEKSLNWKHPTWEEELEIDDEDESIDLLQDISNMFGSADIEDAESLEVETDDEKIGEI